MKGKTTKITNSAKAVVNIHNPPAKRRRRRDLTKKPFVSTIDEKNRVFATHGTETRHPKDSGKEDEINKLKNEKIGLSNQLVLASRQQREAGDPQPPADESDEDRMYRMNLDHKFHYIYHMEIHTYNIKV